ncbi:MAG: transposase [Saprospiraceae bacterium]
MSTISSRTLRTTTTMKHNIVAEASPFVAEASLPRTIHDRECFGYFNPADDLEIYYGDLPHWRQDGVIYFVTFRLADSLSQTQLKQIMEDRETWLRINRNRNHNDFTKEDWETYNELFHQRIEKWLDAGYGSCVLKDIEIIKIVVNALKHFDEIRYRLDSYVIMPNHIHIIVAPFSGYSLSQITHSWKSFTANEINKFLGKNGQLWRHESYDHIIRNEESLINIRQYIKLNPVKAGIQLPEIAMFVS